MGSAATGAAAGPAARAERLDVALVRRGLVESRELARRLILAGRVRLGDRRVDKAAQSVRPDDKLSLEEPPAYVSRGGEKLAGAFAAFPLDVTGFVCLDVGASTGGFTDCLLQHGAARVIALDVGRGQLHWRLRNDPRVCVIEGFNARHLDSNALPEVPDFATVDVAFISLRLILPPLATVLKPGSELVCLIKPQFEAGRTEVGRGGVVRDATVRDRVVDEIRRFGVETVGLEWLGGVTSPLPGPKGNIEFLSWWRTAPA